MKRCDHGNLITHTNIKKRSNVIHNVTKYPIHNNNMRTQAPGRSVTQYETAAT